MRVNGVRFRYTRSAQNDDGISIRIYRYGNTKVTDRREKKNFTAFISRQRDDLCPIAVVLNNSHNSHDNGSHVANPVRGNNLPPPFLLQRFVLKLNRRQRTSKQCFHDVSLNVRYRL